MELVERQTSFNVRVSIARERIAKAILIIVLMMRVICSPQVHPPTIVDGRIIYNQRTMVTGNFIWAGGARAEIFNGKTCVSEKSFYFC
jgi:hypothetical protein